MDPKFYDKNYYVKRCTGYKEFSIGGIHYLYKKYVDLLKLKPYEKFLDIGCGRGEVLKLASRTVEAVGVDYSIAAVKISRSHGSEVIRASATHLPFRNLVFDVVTMLEVLEHLNKDDRLIALKEIHRVLKDDGRLLVTTPNKWWRYFRSLIEVVKELLRGEKPDVKIWFLPTEGHIEELSSFSFLTEILRYFIPRIKLAVRLYNLSLSELSRVIPIFSLGSIWCIARKRK